MLWPFNGMSIEDGLTRIGNGPGTSDSPPGNGLPGVPAVHTVLNYHLQSPRLVRVDLWLDRDSPVPAT